MSSLPTIIETERLILRAIDMEADLEGFCGLMTDPDSVRFIGGKTLSPAATWRVMAMFVGHMTIRGYSFMSVIDKDTGQWVGRVGGWSPLGWPEPEIGWAIHPDHTRRGYAREAGAACIKYMADTFGWTRCIHMIEEGNIGSVKTAESLGAKKLYHLDELPPFGKGDFWAYGQDL